MPLEEKYKKVGIIYKRIREGISVCANVKQR
jgi:hypothetical protein